MSSDQLISISDLIRQARQAGVTFGFGDPKVHLAYLTKLRLLPQTVRRKVNGKIAGCYPENVIARLQQIEEFKNKGLSYAQIRYKLQNNEEEEEVGFPLPAFQTARAYYPRESQFGPNTVAFLIIGLLIGYILAGLNNVNSSITRPVAAATLPTAIETKVDPSLRSGKIPQGIFLIALPNENLYKLGQMSLSDLMK